MNGCPFCGGQREPRFRWQGFRTFRCLGCGAESVEPLPSEAELSAFYQGFNRGSTERWQTRLELVRRAMDRYVARYRAVTGRDLPERFLDLGGGAGYWARAIQDLGAKACLVDYGADAIAFARDVLGVGWALQADLARVEEVVEGTFDFVLCRHSVEHVRDPTLFVEGAARLVAPGGILEIETPDVSSWEQLAHPRIVAMNYAILRRDNPDAGAARAARWAIGKSMSGINPPKHLWGFTPRALTRLLDRAGLAVREVKRAVAGDPELDPLYWDVSGLRTRRGLGIPYYAFERMASLLFRGRGMNLAVLAERGRG